jgi:hypothetical protein
MGCILLRQHDWLLVMRARFFVHALLHLASAPVYNEILPSKINRCAFERNNQVIMFFETWDEPAPRIWARSGQHMFLAVPAIEIHNKKAEYQTERFTFCA